MNKPIRYLVDEHVAKAVATGLRKRGIDVVTLVDAGLLGAEDEDLLPFAAELIRSDALPYPKPATRCYQLPLTPHPHGNRWRRSRPRTHRGHVPRQEDRGRH